MWFFKKKKEKTEEVEFERTVRDLLRENLNTVPVDVFSLDDPLLKLNPDRKSVV